MFVAYTEDSTEGEWWVLPLNEETIREVSCRVLEGREVPLGGKDPEERIDLYRSILLRMLKETDARVDLFERSTAWKKAERRQTRVVAATLEEVWAPFRGLITDEEIAVVLLALEDGGMPRAAPARPL